jgi:hypothetical protein
VIGGSSLNSIGAGVSSATIGGGGNNTVFNTVNATGGTIGGGDNNSIATGAGNSTIGGGYNNRINGPSTYSTIAGGDLNDIGPTGGPNANYATIGGGHFNKILANAHSALISGGSGNQVTSAFGTVGGGEANQATGAWGTVPGGDQNTASYNAFAAGHRAKAIHQGTFVWADSTGADFASTGANQFLIRASGNVGINKNNPATALDVNGTVSATAFNTTSDRNAKENFEAVDAKGILAKLAALPVSQWNFKGDSKVRHIGPTAQDFHAAFRAGSDEKHIATVDADGVALAAIQGLNEIVKEKDAKIVDLEKRLEKLEALLSRQAQPAAGGDR